MKKSGLILSVLLGMILVSTIVAAQSLPSPAPNLPAGNPADLATAFQPVVGLFTGLFTGLAQALNGLTGNTDVGQFVFAKFIIFLILVFVLVTPAEVVAGGSENIAWVVSILMSFLGVYFLPEGVIRLIIVPYNALAVTIMLSLVLLSGFWFFEKHTKTIRKIGWTLLTLAIAGLYVYNAATYEGIDNSIRVAYAIGMLASLSLIFMDSTFHNFYNRLKIEKESQGVAYVKLTALQKEYETVLNAITDAAAQGNTNAIPVLETRKKNLERAMSAAIKQV